MTRYDHALALYRAMMRVRAGEAPAEAVADILVGLPNVVHIRMAKRTALIIMHLYTGELSPAEIAALVGVHKTTVYRVYKKMRQQR